MTVALSPEFSLDGRWVIITGAAGHFGAAFVETMLEAGASVFMFGRSPKLADLAETFSRAFGRDRAIPIRADCSDDAAFRRALAEAVERSGGIDVLVNNAFEFSPRTGFNDPSGRFELIGRDQWMRGLESGVYWHAAAAQVVAESMKARGKGSIINISSMYGIVSPDPALYEGRTVFNPPTYSAAKAALLGLTRYIAAFYGKFGVRCNAMLPGAFPNTDPTAFNRPSDVGFLKLLSDRTVLGRVGALDDLKGPLLFLASDASKYVTGHGLVVDGGWTIR